jgi:hypothetical protein
MAKNQRTEKNKKLVAPKAKSQPKATILPFETEIVGREANVSKRTDHKFIIFCEGETEENYFKGIGESWTLLAFCAPTISIKCLKPSDNTAKGLLLEALQTIHTRTTSNNIKQQIIPDYDQIWVVFDADEHDEQLAPLFGDNPKSFLLPLSTQEEWLFDKYFEYIQIAFSNRAFEHWILLHFERNTCKFAKTECKTAKETHGCALEERTIKQQQYLDCLGKVCTVGYLRQKKYHPQYQKGDWRRKKDNKEKNKTPYCFEGLKDSTVYGDLTQEKLAFQKMRNAIENAQYLRHFSNAPRPMANPYTDLDKLIGAIIRYEPVITWGKFGEKITRHNWQILIEQNSKTLNVTICNCSKKAIILNNETVKAGIFYNNEHFYRYCQPLTTEITATFLHPSDTKTLNLPLPPKIVNDKVYQNITYCLEIEGKKFWVLM